jgi:hypothetical protein
MAILLAAIGMKMCALEMMLAVNEYYLRVAIDDTEPIGLSFGGGCRGLARSPITEGVYNYDN